MVQEISCSICGEGTLKKKKKHRLSGPAVFIGYVLLIPGIIGLLIGIVLLFTTGKATVDVTENMQTEIETTLKEKGVPDNIIQKVLSTETISESELAVLSEDQKSAVETAEWTLTGGTVGAGIGAAVAGSISIGIIVSSLIGCLLGFILTMKKKVLQCKNCGAIIQAS